MAIVDHGIAYLLLVPINSLGYAHRFYYEQLHGDFVTLTYFSWVKKEMNQRMDPSTSYCVF